MKKTRVIPHTEWAAPSLWSARPATIGVLLFALTTLGIGEGLLVLADLGSAPWTVLSRFGVKNGSGDRLGILSYQYFGDAGVVSLTVKTRFGHLA